jgi:1-acyl-sn-glycerol-3-phosphate acyltransferase
MGVYSSFISARALILVPLLTALGSILAVPISYFDRDGRFFHRFIARSWARAILWLAGVRVTVDGLDNIPQSEQSCIVVMNHQSHLDIPLIVHSVPLQLRFIAKIELKRVPVFGSAILRSGHFFVERQDHRHALEGIKAAGESVNDKNLSLVFAPEGTRSPDGRMLPFKKGAFVMSIEADLPILPVSIIGTAQRLPKGSLHARSGPVRVVIHPMLFPSGLTYNDRDFLTEKVRKIIEKPLTDKVED